MFRTECVILTPSHHLKSVRPFSLPLPSLVNEGSPPFPFLDDIGSKYVAIKQKVIELEQAILSGLGFDLAVDLPYTYLGNMLHLLNCRHDVAELSWSLLNDCFFDPICIELSSSALACGSLFLAAKLIKFTAQVSRDDLAALDDRTQWWTKLEVQYSEVERFSDVMLELFKKRNAVPDAPVGPTKADKDVINISDSPVKLAPRPMKL